jgi:hypothetical protein
MKSLKSILGLVSLLTLLSACGQDIPMDSKPVSHEQFDQLLQKHVSAEGHVNYEGFAKDSAKFQSYLDLLSSAHPNTENWSSDERKAYWINAYNAFTIDLIVRSLPVETIKDIGGAIYKVNTVWDIRFIDIQGVDYDLNNIEHQQLREHWSDPRIHFAIVCASASCPRLDNHAYFAENLDEQLDAAAVSFINDPMRNKLGEEPELSRIFKWFKSDFTDVSPSLIDFINQYAETKLDVDADVEYLEYDWSLND